MVLRIPYKSWKRVGKEKTHTLWVYVFMGYQTKLTKLSASNAFIIMIWSIIMIWWYTRCVERVFQNTNSTSLSSKSEECKNKLKFQVEKKIDILCLLWAVFKRLWFSADDMFSIIDWKSSYTRCHINILLSSVLKNLLARRDSATNFNYISSTPHIPKTLSLRSAG